MKISNSAARSLLIGSVCFLLGACDEPPEKAWIVIDFEMPNGELAQMSFDNPSVPNLTLEKCEEALPGALPNLISFAEKEPRLSGAIYQSAKCVWSADDPIKPRE